MIRIKEYPPVIGIVTIVEDKLLGAKSYTTVKKRLGELGVHILKYDLVRTDQLFESIMKEEKAIAPVISRKSKPFKLR